MNPKKIKVLIFEGNDFLRNQLKNYIYSDTLMNVTGVYRSPEQWRPSRNSADAPEVIILGLSDDDEANRRNLWALRGIRAKIIAVAETRAEETQYADLVNYFVCRVGDLGEFGADDLYGRLKYQIKSARLALAVEKVRSCDRMTTFPKIEVKEDRVEESVIDGRRTDIKLIAIGASAGGTEAIMKLIPSLPEDMPAIALVQHMPRDFVELFAVHLREKSRMRVCLAVGGERMERGTVYVTALDRHLTTIQRSGNIYIGCEDSKKHFGIRPSVDMLFHSSALAAGKNAIGVILTGMGSDGAAGLLEMRRAGAYTIGQDEESSVVYGMPQAAYKNGAVIKQLPLSLIADELQKRTFPNERRRYDE